MLYRFIFLMLIFTLVSCNDEPYGSTNTENNDLDGNNTVNGFTPLNGYWKFDVISSSEDVPEMNFSASDSVYVSEIFQDSFTISVNDDGVANGTMNMILSSGNLYSTPNSLSLNGIINIPEDLSSIGLLNDITLTGLKIFDLSVENGDILFFQEDSFNNSIELEETEIPINLSYEIQTKKNNFHNSINLNGISYNNVFEGNLAFTISVDATFSLLGFSQTVAIFEPQDIISINYYYAESIGLVRAESYVGYEISTGLTQLSNLTGFNLDFPTNLEIEVIEELNEFIVE
ncbi:MAG: hypothetical protein CMC86_04125 [Flavobacteriaceae bacterium]|nr:hypothetical protein [Flavobacteriaceae bacterium]